MTVAELRRKLFEIDNQDLPVHFIFKPELYRHIKLSDIDTCDGSDGTTPMVSILLEETVFKQ